jgi:hypothetical protein
MDALIDGRGGQRQAQPVTREFTHLRTRQTHPLGHGTDDGDQRRPGQVPFAQLHRPRGLAVAAPGQRSAPMPTGTKRLQIGVLGLPENQAIAPAISEHQFQLIAGIVCPALVRLIEDAAANGTTWRRMDLLGIHQQLLGAAVPRRALAPALYERPNSPHACSVATSAADSPRIPAPLASHQPAQMPPTPPRSPSSSARSHGARVLGGRKLLDGFCATRSRAAFRSSSALLSKARAWSGVSLARAACCEP